MLLVWDKASWHRSQAVRRWMRDHNRQVKQEGKGVRIVSCQLPIKSPWLPPWNLTGCRENGWCWNPTGCCPRLT